MRPNKTIGGIALIKNASKGALGVLLIGAGIAAVATPAAAQMRPWGGRAASDSWRDGPGAWGDPMTVSNPRSTVRDLPDSREGQVTSEHFSAQDAGDRLGQGGVTVMSKPDSTPDARDRLTYEAALIDRLVMAGYDSQLPPDEIGQVAEIRVIRTVAEPAEQKRSPVSGSTAVSVSNRGTAYGMAVNVDLTKPKTALLSTRMELRIRDRETNEVLWESRAQIWTREDDEHWEEGDIATRLSAALLEGFPTSIQGPA